MIFFGEQSLAILRHCLETCASHYHTERNHHGKDNVIPFQVPTDRVGESRAKCVRGNDSDYGPNLA
jgi:hypothetical protein